MTCVDSHAHVVAGGSCAGCGLPIQMAGPLPSTGDTPPWRAPPFADLDASAACRAADGATHVPSHALGTCTGCSAVLEAAGDERRPDLVVRVMLFEDLTALGDADTLSAAGTVAYGLAVEGAAHGVSLAEHWTVDVAWPVAQAAADWVTGPGLDHLAAGAGSLADGVLDQASATFDAFWATAVTGGAIDRPRPSRSGLHPRRPA